MGMNALISVIPLLLQIKIKQGIKISNALRNVKGRSSVDMIVFTNAMNVSKDVSHALPLFGR